MAEKRMFAKSIVLSDSFLDMPMSARCLYFTLGMLADDDGFAGSPKGIMRQCGASQDDMNVLIAKRFVLGFDSGVIVIKHWRMNNYLRNDRYKPTSYVDEMKTLTVGENGAYTEVNKQLPDNGIQEVSAWYTQSSIDKSSKEESSKEKKSVKDHFGEYRNVKLTQDELNRLVEDFGSDYVSKAIKFLDEYIEEKGYKSKSHNLTIRKWVIDAVKERETKTKGKTAQMLDDSYRMMEEWSRQYDQQ